VQVYYSESDKEAYARAAKDSDEVLAFLAHTTNRWAYGQCQRVRERMSLRVPDANCVSANVAASAQGRLDLSKQWVRHVEVHHGADIVFVIVQASVYGFSLETGQRLLSWEGIHPQRICQACPHMFSTALMAFKCHNISLICLPG
jgi:hypothetical protein